MSRFHSLPVACTLITLLGSPLLAQGNEKTTTTSTTVTAPESDTAAVEDSSVTQHTVRIGGQSVPYQATIGRYVIHNDKGEPIGLMYYTAYRRTDVTDLAHRPIAFLYNGGPGSASVWIQMGAFGPRRVATRDAAYTPPAPYELTDNTNSLLDKTDLVFIDPIGTGFSHPIAKGTGKDFWGVDEDSHTIGQFIERYVTRNGRWNSPKFLIGESYGTFRSAALANYLQGQYSMDINGIVLMSSVLDLGTINFSAGDDRDYIFYLPSYAATAWYHKALANPPADLPAFLDEVRKYAVTDYAAALMQGSSLPASEKSAVAARLSQYTGLSQDYLMRANLRVSEPQFTAELQRSRGLVTGRLDARFSGPAGDLLSEYAFSDPQSDAISSAFVAEFNSYIRDELKYSPHDRAYVSLSGEANGAWDWKHGDPSASASVMGDLAQAILTNPNLRVQIENGYYDLATPFFATEYTRTHLGLPDSLTGNVELKYYMAGHMMYVRDDDLAKLKVNVADFIDRASRPSRQ